MYTCTYTQRYTYRCERREGCDGTRIPVGCEAVMLDGQEGQACGRLSWKGIARDMMRLVRYPFIISTCACA